MAGDDLRPERNHGKGWIFTGDSNYELIVWFVSLLSSVSVFPRSPEYWSCIRQKLGCFRVDRRRTVLSATKPLLLFCQVRMSFVPRVATKSSCLYGLLNRCRTSMGSRKLSSFLKQPLMDIDEIGKFLCVLTHCVEKNKLWPTFRRFGFLLYDLAKPKTVTLNVSCLCRNAFGFGATFLWRKYSTWNSSGNFG